MKLSEKTAEPIVAMRSVDVNVGLDDVAAASIEELLAGMDASVDDVTLTEMFLGDDSLDTVISGGDVDNYNYGRSRTVMQSMTLRIGECSKN